MSADRAAAEVMFPHRTSGTWSRCRRHPPRTPGAGATDVPECCSPTPATGTKTDGTGRRHRHPSVVPPDSSRRRGKSTRPGWDGLYAFMRRVLSTDRARSTANGTDDRARLRQHEVQPQDHQIPPNRQAAVRTECADHGHPQPPQAPQPPTRRCERLTATAANRHSCSAGTRRRALRRASRSYATASRVSSTLALRARVEVAARRPACASPSSRRTAAGERSGTPRSILSRAKPPGQMAGTIDTYFEAWTRPTTRRGAS